nr:subtilisin-like protease [Ipomoea batatas]GMC60770.1 subtilisin-like protease [Ipomoea batatas]GMC72404.1 subtilisin-like protease [Ipomoea batatas]GMC76275.1 subtilisin-like protease [Ipomoea batatas]GMC78244.1 subtilisin-like protease [Ipomoea batatas]
MVEAATVKIQGASFHRVPGDGPEFPAAQTTAMPLSTAWNVPIAIASVEKSVLSVAFLYIPREMDNMWTPSPMASSTPFSTDDPRHRPTESQTR